jgi:hypothetical protein
LEEALVYCCGVGSQIDKQGIDRLRSSRIEAGPTKRPARAPDTIRENDLCRVEAIPSGPVSRSIRTSRYPSASEPDLSLVRQHGAA